MEKSKNYSKKNGNKTIEEIFFESFPKKENTKENILLFQNSIVANISKTNLEPDQAIDELFNIVKKNKDDNELLDCIQSASKTLISHFFIRKPKVMEAIFFPSEDSEYCLINWLAKSKSTLLICVFTITNNRLADQIYVQHKKNVKTRVITDDECSKQLGSDVFDLANAGIPVRLDNNPKSHMHNKFVVIDSRIVITGSFNWTVAAVDSNQENLCIIDNESLAEKYTREYEKLWKAFEKSAIKSDGSGVIKRFSRLNI